MEPQNNHYFCNSFIEFKNNNFNLQIKNKVDYHLDLDSMIQEIDQYESNLINEIELKYHDLLENFE